MIDIRNKSRGNVDFRGAGCAMIILGILLFPFLIPVGVVFMIIGFFEKR